MTHQNLGTPEELFHYLLRSAHTMEQHSLEALDELHSAASDRKVKKLFSHHADETREQIRNLEKVFSSVGYDFTTAPSPATTGIKKQASALLEKADSGLYDEITLLSAMGNEYFEIATYTGLMLQAQRLGAHDSVQLLKANLDQEIHTSEELRTALEEITK